MLIAFCASAAVIAGASLLAGQAILSLCGWREASWVAGPVGLAALVAACAIVTGVGGEGGVVALALVAIVAVAAVIVVVRGTSWADPSELRIGIGAALLAALFASLPFIASGRIGILGVGLVNDDMASHLLLADWLDDRFTPEPVLVHQGYPLGPHSLVAGVSSLLGAGTIEVFAGLTIGIPMLMAALAAGAVRGPRPVVRIGVGALVALPYMAAAYLAQEAFKEPIMALLVIGFALLLPRVRFARDAIPLGVIAAGVVYTYSFPGLAWLVGTALIWGLLELASRRRLDLGGVSATVRRAVPGLIVVVIVALALTAVDWSRIVDFADFRALHPSQANEGGLGNLREHLSPLEGLGIWPTSEFRLAAGAGSLPALAFYLGAAVAVVVVVVGLPRWLRRNGSALPAALAAAIVIYVGARAFGTVYTSAKAIAIAAPIVVLLGLGGLLGDDVAHASGSPGLRRRRLSPPAMWPPSLPTASRPRRIRRGPARAPALTALAAVFAIGAALSSFLVLRQAPVGPHDHMDELARIRPIVAGQKVLFLGRDNFVLYELRGSKPFTHVRNFYDPYFVKPNFELLEVGSKFDFDALTAEKLARFPYVITTRAPYASGPPPSYRPVLETSSYVLWKRRGEVKRTPLETGPQPGRADLPACEAPAASGRGVEAAFFAAIPVRRQAAAWSPSTTLEDGATTSVRLDLPRGSWQLSLQYDATRSLTLTAPGLDSTLPGNLDYRGVAPYWPAGRIRVAHGGPVRVEAEVEPPPITGRALGASSVAHLGALAATRVGPTYVDGARPPFPGQGVTLGALGERCPGYGDWAPSPLPGG